MKQKEVALREKEELQRKIDDLEQELAFKDDKKVSVQCEYTIIQAGMCVYVVHIVGIVV